ncbi:MAG TPA: nucleoside-diphosphate sugar epimerase/dehydratase [bacterium]
MNSSLPHDFMDTSLTRLGKVLVDVTACTAAIVASFALRFSTSTVLFYVTREYEIILMAVGLQVIGLTLLGLYSAMWRYTSLHTIFKLASVTTVSLIVTSLAQQLLDLPHLPRSVIVLDWFLANFLCAGARLLARRIHVLRALRQRSEEPDQKILIYGAGNAGELMLRSINQAADIHIEVVGFVDDRMAKQGLTIHGRRVLGTGDDIGRLVEEHQINSIFVAIPSLSGVSFRTLLDKVRSQAGHRVQIRTLPGVTRVANGLVSIDQIRKVEISDLLRRERVQLDETIVRDMLQDHPVMVVGGGGSIGRELCKQIARHKPKQLVVVDSCEFNTYLIDDELRKDFPNLQLTCLVADGGNKAMMRRIFSQYRPDFVFHAAAYKHVPLMEAHPWAAVVNNLRCTQTLAELAGQFGVQRFILISSDKAVRPTNVMGATKRICELMVLAHNRISSTSFTAVRFGNVLGSSGSVIPKFAEQIAHGGPVTVTHPDITRYFMLIPEAVELVLQVSAIGQRGNLYVLDMGKPIRIAELAQSMINLACADKEKDIKIVYTGLRPGEKLHESLYFEGDESATQIPNLFVIQPKNVGDAAFLSRVNGFVERACDLDQTQLMLSIKQFAPEYQPQFPENSPARVLETSLRVVSETPVAAAPLQV